MTAYYNEIDRDAAAWLRELIAMGAIPSGDVDERSVEDVEARDLAGYEQCHFFAGIGGWPLALELAGWDGPVWTGSCPCQPLSGAGLGKGHADERHVWPAFYRLIAECRPATVIGEQVASSLGREWLAGVRADLENVGYACGAADLCAAGAGAPHIRQRLFWVADAKSKQSPQFNQHKKEREIYAWVDADGCSNAGRVAEPQGVEHDRGRDAGRGRGKPANGGGLDNATEPRRTGDGQCGADKAPRDKARLREPARSGASGRLGDTDRPAQERQRPVGLPLEPEQETGRPGNANYWAGREAIGCADGKARRFEPGIFPLVDGVPGGMGHSGDQGISEEEANATAEARVMRLRGYGNAIVPQVAAEFVAAWMEAADA